MRDEGAAGIPACAIQRAPKNQINKITGMLMKRTLLLAAVVTAAWLMQSTAGIAQTDTTVPGGATGANVFCMQVGNVKTGAFEGTIMETGDGVWESHTMRELKKSTGDLPRSSVMKWQSRLPFPVQSPARLFNTIC